MSLAEAREEARQVWGQVERGVNPVDPVHKTGTFADISARYLKVGTRNLKRPEIKEQYHRTYLLPHFGHVKADEITRQEVRTFIHEIAETRGHLSNRLLAEIRAFYNWAISEDLVENNPAANVKSVYRERERERVLTDEELVAILKAVAQERHPWRTYVPFLIYTGCRRGEAQHLEWEHVEGDLWTVPGSQYKTGRPHTVPLSPGALRILGETPRVGPYVFGEMGCRPLGNGYRLLLRLHKAVGVSDWSYHDIRRTVRTGMSRLGVQPHIAELVIGHTLPGIIKTYDRHAYLAERREALQLWARHVEGFFDLGA
jgi:integrase